MLPFSPPVAGRCFSLLSLLLLGGVDFHPHSLEWRCLLALLLLGSASFPSSKSFWVVLLHTLLLLGGGDFIQYIIIVAIIILKYGRTYLRSINTCSTKT